MISFSGLEIKPYSQLTDLPRVKIDRVRVEVQRTLFGEVEYHLPRDDGRRGARVSGLCANERPSGRLGGENGNRGAHLQGAHGGDVQPW